MSRTYRNIHSDPWELYMWSATVSRFAAQGAADKPTWRARYVRDAREQFAQARRYRAAQTGVLPMAIKVPDKYAAAIEADVAKIPDCAFEE